VEYKPCQGDVMLSQGILRDKGGHLKAFYPFNGRIFELIVMAVIYVLTLFGLFSYPGKGGFSMDLIKSKKLSKSSTDQKQSFIPSSTSQYIKAIKDILVDEYSSPSSDSIHYFINRLSPAITSEKTVDQFHSIVKKAFDEFVDDRISDVLQLQKPADPGKKTDTHQSMIDVYGRVIKHDIFMRDEDFEKFFVVDVT
jgi:hypothetical protein